MCVSAEVSLDSQWRHVDAIEKMVPFVFSLKRTFFSCSAWFDGFLKPGLLD